MSQDYYKTVNEVRRILNNGNTASLKLQGEKYVIISDSHLTDGSSSDNFQHNEEVLYRTLEEYRKKKFKLILLGDIEDLWKQDKPNTAKNRYDNSIYRKMREFDEGKVYRVWGNHDEYWKSKDTDKEDPVFDRKWGEVKHYEAIKFMGDNNNVVILALHGHQGSVESQIYAAISKPFVKLYGRIIEKVFGRAKNKAEPNSKIDSNYEKVFYRVASEEKVIILCGHSHYAIFESKCYANVLKDKIDELKKQIAETTNPVEKHFMEARKKSLEIKLEVEKKWKREIAPIVPNAEPVPCYFNTGCCIYEYGVTCIELEEDKLRLVKWDENFKKNIFGEGRISEYYKKVAGEKINIIPVSLKKENKH